MSGINRPFKYGAKDRREYIVQDSEVEIRAQNDASGNVLYLGYGKTGAADSEAKWQISFHAYDGNDSLTSKTWPQDANGNPSTDYEFIWDDRVALTYS